MGKKKAITSAKKKTYAMVTLDVDLLQKLEDYKKTIGLEVTDSAILRAALRKFLEEKQ